MGCVGRSIIRTRNWRGEAEMFSQVMDISVTLSSVASWSTGCLTRDTGSLTWNTVTKCGP